MKVRKRARRRRTGNQFVQETREDRASCLIGQNLRKISAALDHDALRAGVMRLLFLADVLLQRSARFPSRLSAANRTR